MRGLSARFDFSLFEVFIDELFSLVRAQGVHLTNLVDEVDGC